MLPPSPRNILQSLVEYNQDLMHSDKERTLGTTKKSKVRNIFNNFLYINFHETSSYCKLVITWCICDILCLGTNLMDEKLIARRLGAPVLLFVNGSPSAGEVGSRHCGAAKPVAILNFLAQHCRRCMDWYSATTRDN